MQQTTEQSESRQPEIAAVDKNGKLMNLRPFLRLRLGLAAVALVVGLLWVVNMTFGAGAFKSPTTDPKVAQAAWQELVADTIDDKRPADEPLALPTSENPGIGLVLVRSSIH